MKKVWLMLAMMVCVLASCNDGGSEDPVNPTPKPEEIKTEITIDSSIISNGLSFGVAGSEQSISFSVNADWTLSVASTSSGATWCKASATSGSKGTANVKFTVDENTGYDDRSVSVTIKASSVSKTFTITQKGADALLVTTNKYEVAQEGGQIEIEVKANIEYQMEISETAKSWITEASSRALTTYKHTLDIALNEDAEKREGEITFKSGDKVETVKVYQAGGALILLSENEYTVSDVGDTISVDIKSNVEYGIQMPDVDWITDEASSRGMSSHTLKYVIATNEGYDSRSAEIIFYDKNSDLKETLKIVQAQKDAIVISEKNFNINREGGTIEVKVNTNVDFEVQIPSDVTWVSQTDSRALTEKSIYLKIAENKGDDAREAEIVFINKESQISENITVSQAGAVKAGYENGVVTIATAGTMKKLLGDDYLNITSLKVVGPINGDDIYYLHKMIRNDGKLVDLDLSEATNVDGYNNDYWEDLFYKCNLRNVVLPKDLLSIGKAAFEDCNSLESIVIPDSVRSIGFDAFYSCGSLASIVIPDNVTSIGGGAFMFCRSLESVTIGNGVTSIGVQAFACCSSLTTLTIGKNVELIDYVAFYDCEKLEAVYISDLSAWCNITFDHYFSEIDNGRYHANPLYYGAKLYLNNKELTELVIPDDVKYISSGAFYNFAHVTKVTIGDNLEQIRDYSFWSCDSLTEVTIGKKVGQIGIYAFYGSPVAKCYSYASTPPSIIPPTFTPTTESVLYVPKGCISKYAVARGWEKFKNIEAME